LSEINIYIVEFMGDISKKIAGWRNAIKEAEKTRKWYLKGKHYPLYIDTANKEINIYKLITNIGKIKRVHGDKDGK
jgi:hypothetical protein